MPAAPRWRGRWGPWDHGPYAALDFETTGLDFAKDRIISFGVVPVDTGHVDLDRAAYELVDPGSVPISAASAAVHGLTAEDLAGARSADAARDLLRRALGGRFLLTWHGIVEASFLGMLFGTRPERWLHRSVDVRWLVLAILGEDGDRLTLSEAADRFDVRVTTPHHALDDALVTARLFLATATELAPGLRSVRDALRIGRGRGRLAKRPVLPR
jgi:DNA polymerase-3 subunit epsilon